MIVVEGSTVHTVTMDPKDDEIVKNAPVSGRRF